MKGIILTGCYMALAGVAIAYELSIRIYDTGNSEFAGMLSFLLTLPASLIVSFIASRGFGTRVGDSNTTFVVILGLAALVNACGIYAVVRRRKMRP